jgi:hypothetical protein
MRTSQRVVAATLGAIIVLLLVIAISIRVSAPTAPALSGERASRTYDYASFNGIEISGQWQVSIERGDAWRVAVDAPAELLDSLRVEQDGDRLELEIDGGSWFGGFGRNNDGPKVTIAMPVLESLELSGASTVSFSGFEGARLSIASSGAAEIRAATSRFDTLTLQLSGAGNADHDEISVANAEVSVSGAANVTLNMAGGRLTGSMSGAGNLEYRGTVTEQSIDSSGLVNIRRVD